MPDHACSRCYSRRHPFDCSLTTTLKSVHVLRYLEPRAEEAVLDVGCGLGFFLNRLAGRGLRGFGLDFSAKSLGLARQIVDCSLAQGDAQCLPYRDDSFDKIIFTDVLEHVFDDRQTLREVARIGRDGAKVALVTPGTRGALARTSWRKLFHDEAGTPEFDERPGYVPEELRRLMEANGIRVVRMRQTLIFVGEFLLQATKKYLKMKKLHYQTQGDIVNITDSGSYRIYRRFVFPLFWGLARLEDMLLGRVANGHSLIALGVVDKSLLGDEEVSEEAFRQPLAAAVS